MQSESIQVLRAMRVTAYFLLATSLHLSATTVSQTVTFQGTNVPIKKVFTELTRQTGLSVAYTSEVLSGAKPVTAKVHDMPVPDFLQQVFTGQPFQFVLEGKTVFVSRKVTAAFNLRSNSDLFSGIHGRVTDSAGTALIGATVSVSGTRMVAITSGNGEFSFRELPENAVLMISFVGYAEQRILIEGRTDIQIQLHVLSGQLENVQVTLSTGYQTVSKERFVGAVTKIDNTLLRRETSTDLVSRLDGITNGLLFDKRGGKSNLQIRGISGLNNSLLQPLIILDNFPYYGDLGNINPNDIADITFLKDAAAASVWGSRAGNGVIVLNSKKGKYNEPFRIEVNSSINIQQKPDLFYFPQISSSDFIDVEKFLFDNGKYDDDLNNATGTFPVVSPVVEILDKARSGTISQADAEKQINSFRNTDTRNDYNKYVFRNSINQQHHISLKGGSDAINYMFSAGYDHNLSAIKGPGGYQRFTINSSTEFKPTRFIEFHAGLHFSQGIQNGDGLSYPLSPGNGKSQLYPYARLADDLGNPIAVMKDYRTSFADANSAAPLLDWHYRPLDELGLADNTSKTLFYQLDLGAMIHFTPWLNAELKYQYGQQQNTSENNQRQETYYTRNLINLYSQVSGGSVINTIPLGGILDIAHNETINQSWRGQVNVSKSFSKHSFNALAAAEINETKNKSNSDRVYGYNDKILTYNGIIDYVNAYPDFFGNFQYVPNLLSLSQGVNRFVSLVANGSYTYNNKYTFYASGRRDGANIFGVNANQKWKPLWSTGINWDITKESFYRLQWMGVLKLRASYGVSGNVNNSISGLTTLNYGGVFPFTQLTYATINNPPNPNLRWEKVGMLNIGLDIGLWKSRLSASIDWYSKKSSDIITNVPVDPTLGTTLSSILLNAANLKGKGIDVAVQSRNLVGRFSWTTSINFNHSKTIVTKYFQNPVTGIPAGSDINPNEGKIAFGLYSYHWGGLDPVNGDPRGIHKGVVGNDYLDIINDSIQNQVLNGSSLPLNFGNVMNTFSWKSFSISANIVYRFNYYFRKQSINYADLFDRWIGHSDYSLRWQKPGDEMHTNVPSMIYPADPNRDIFYQGSEINVAKADNIRLQDIRVSYEWTVSSKKHFPVKSAQVYLYANNLHIMLWKADGSGIDPDYGLYLPPARSVAMGININF